ncbi:myelin-oligodendrocyte glycoprotein-like [Polymixia lowei]
MYLDEEGNISSDWIFTVNLTFLLLFVCRSVGGQSQLIGSPQPIVAIVGDDIILPCHLQPAYNVEDLTVEWSRPDLKPDSKGGLSRKYVHLYRDRREILAMKNPSYIGRTILFKEGLKYGNASLKLMNVKLADEGKYRCFIPKLNSQIKESIIRLNVEQLPQDSTKTTSTEKPWQPRTPNNKEEMDVGGNLQVNGLIVGVSCVLGTLCLAVFGFVLIRRIKKTHLHLGNYSVVEISKPEGLPERVVAG